MFDEASRYAAVEIAYLRDADGRTVAYARRRFLPRGATLPLLIEVPAVPGDRLDLIAARTLGDPEAFWRLCDANDTLDPAELTSEPGMMIRVPFPQP